MYHIYQTWCSVKTQFNQFANTFTSQRHWEWTFQVLCPLTVVSLSHCIFHKTLLQFHCSLSHLVALTASALLHSPSFSRNLVQPSVFAGSQALTNGSSVQPSEECRDWHSESQETMHFRCDVHWRSRLDISQNPRRDKGQWQSNILFLYRNIFETFGYKIKMIN